ncbi:MAG: hypothetical protein GY789_15690 [Hyphomicrobiales bacterium]|nr:hypothetical protein [Hyphomicrobiales bacterium]MCP4999849.1 hypothetical protein [Hyphomicrobiales bacterium]
MDGKYTNNLQAALLFEGEANICPSIHLNQFRGTMLEKNLPLNIGQENETFALFIGPDELYISVTYYNEPAEHGVFAFTLQSGLSNMLCEDAPARVQRHRSHVLVGIWHGALGTATDDPKIAEMFDQIGMPRPGHSLDMFNLRVDVLSEVCRHLIEFQPASAVHWTQSNLMIAGDKALTVFDQERPGLLTVHPIMFGVEKVPGFD